MYLEIRQQLDQADVTLVAVSKTKPNDQILEMYHKGQRIFGENKAQELVDKYEALPNDIDWHFVGHLQRNKVKYIAPFVSLLHGVDSLRLLKEVNKQAQKHERIIHCLLQFHIATETTKFGLDLQEAQGILDSEEFKAMENISISGVMGMATFTDDEHQVSNEFKRLKSIFNHLKAQYFSDDEGFKEISMGMSGDYQIAIEEGSTMVRIGTLLFGQRNY
ncbi:MAG: YggS family pyridoxal phosphate-dependent enzyme [Bacteroidota bacterium]